MLDIAKLSPLHIYILIHLRRANIDYAKSISKITKIDQQEIEKALKELEELGLIDRSHGSAIKRTAARFKLSHEVHKHHTYYCLTRLGEHTSRMLRDLLGDYLSSITGYDAALDIIEYLAKAECEHAGWLARVFSMKVSDVQSLLTKLLDLGLLSECKAKVLKKKHRKGKPKKETRTHHTYYRLSRLGEMMLRYIR
ncbi:Uncharacterized protein conserved in archaea [Archaeoglobus sulfaticallidus PM70-1]|uniref:Uncharacterized protein conserved in archaea n=1 Tax=Archaeoglobus sulfaticallidus PM70-1 TaxID=387631 RepID=N0BK51_9EURY|nr:DUF2250 domain-containing protein [Archaeoglobus sulfaticallidus]AGK60881.1 Uncharacterized protein conserved in archaea [Archaeoglobus sulfaticallidus PM70-1]